ncbi:MAG: hypothetical protein U0166_26950 [Acidobacteriota bacterium]
METENVPSPLPSSTASLAPDDWLVVTRSGLPSWSASSDSSASDTAIAATVAAGS